MTENCKGERNMPHWFPELLMKIGEDPDLAAEYWEEMERDIEEINNNGGWLAS